MDRNHPRLARTAAALGSADSARKPPVRGAVTNDLRITMVWMRDGDD